MPDKEAEEEDEGMRFEFFVFETINAVMKEKNLQDKSQYYWVRSIFSIDLINNSSENFITIKNVSLIRNHQLKNQYEYHIGREDKKRK